MKTITELLEGVEMPEPVAWMHTQANYSIISTHQKETNEFQFTDDFLAGHDKGLHTADQLRSTVAAAVAKKERDMLESANRNGHLAAAIEIVDALKAENEKLRQALEGVMPWVVTQQFACHGMKCREALCQSCSVETDASEETARTAANAAYAALKGQP